MDQAENDGGRLHRRPSLADDVYDSLIDALVSNTIPPGHPFNIDAFARQLGVSPTPVREALVRAESEGLVESRPRSGFRTSPLMTEIDKLEMAQVRLLVEPWAAARAAENASSSDGERLRELGKYSPAQDGSLNYRVDMLTDAEFHYAIWELSGNAILRRMLKQLHCHFHMYRSAYSAELRKVSELEHLRIADAIAEGDAEAAESAMREHISRRRAVVEPLAVET